MSGPQDSLRTQSAPPAAPAASDNLSTNMNSTIFAVSFVFLTLVLLGFGWKQWTAVQKQYEKDIQRTVDSFIGQAAIASKASIHTNKLFSLSYGPTLMEVARNKASEETISQLWQDMNQTFFHLTGFMIARQNGEVMHIQGPLLDVEEKRLITLGLLRTSEQGGFFAFHYGESGGFYAVNWFDYQSQKYAFIVRRPYNNFSEVIRDSAFPGFDLAFYDKALDKVLITKGHYYQFAEAPTFTQVQGRLEYKRPMINSNWELLALKHPDYLNEQQLKIFLPIAIILLVFIILAFSVGYILRYMQRQQIRRSSNEQKNL